MIGADISNHQRSLSMGELIAQGVEFVIIKATQGTHFVDPCGAEFYMAAREAGLPAGVYCYSEATTPAEADAEARYLLGRIRGMPMPCGIWMDVETTEQLRMPDDALTATVKAFCAVIREAGYVPGVYSSEHSAWAKLDRAALGEDVLVWVAHYGKTPEMPCDLWQYTDTHPLFGHDFRLDVDITRSDRFRAMVETAQKHFPDAAETVPDACPLDAPSPAPNTAAALALLAAYLQTEEFAQNFKSYTERSIKK